MALESRQPAFPLLKAAFALTAMAAVLYAAAAFIIPAIFSHSQGALAGVSAMACVAWLSLLLSVVPVAAVGRFGVMPAVYAYFFGAAARFVIGLAALAVMVKVMNLPAGPVAVTLAWMYIPLLFLEAGLVGRYIWQKDFLNKNTASTRGKEALA